MERLKKLIKEKYKGIPTIDKENFTIEKSREGVISFIPNSYEQLAYENNEEPNDFGDSEILNRIQIDLDTIACFISRNRKIDENNKIQKAIDCIQGMFIWSDRIGSDEISELIIIEELLKETLPKYDYLQNYKNKKNGKK